MAVEASTCQGQWAQQKMTSLWTAVKEIWESEIHPRRLVWLGKAIIAKMLKIIQVQF